MVHINRLTSYTVVLALASLFYPIMYGVLTDFQNWTKYVTIYVICLLMGALVVFLISRSEYNDSNSNPSDSQSPSFENITKSKIQYLFNSSNFGRILVNLGFGIATFGYIFWFVWIFAQHSNDTQYITTAIMAIPSLLVAVITFLYVLLTQDLVRTNQALFDAQTKPDLIAYLQIDKTDNPAIIDLIIENIGFGIAQNIKINSNPSDFPIISGMFDSHSIVQKGISILGPKQKVSIKICDAELLVGHVERFFHPDNIPEFQVALQFQNSIGKQMEKKQFSINIAMFKDQ